jgi:hypothetical protein
MTNLPRGHAIVFYNLKEKDPKHQAKHAMISIGKGQAIGSKSNCLDPHESPAWARVDLLNKGRYVWGKGGTFTTVQDGRVLTCFHREITQIGVL